MTLKPQTVSFKSIAAKIWPFSVSTNLVGSEDQNKSKKWLT